ncbi:MAG: AMP-binding protein [Desulfobacterales bacterium]|jgi:long-chain acyl-CoA synthetase|nr:AMP-binding protein [Desulfobacteraceae bacterium]MBT4363867.1 AMP-binding protein [Desulfobacteraceae bacterium]MBT7086612.1 AMP-binding protein [Desulfobacterales bacterium]MBT7696512.1 AMP-binding protein [Desulfobacterales bacterium]
MAEILLTWAESKPDQMALADEYSQITWGEFNSNVNKLIQSLRDAGLETGDTFSVLSGNRNEYYEILSAAANGGWSYVPINWHFTAEEVAYVIENSDSKAFIADSRFAEVASDTVARDEVNDLKAKIIIGKQGKTPDGFILYDDFISDASDSEPDDQSLGGPMFYTSGTTGRPKGVKSSSFQAGGSLEILRMIGEGTTQMMQMPPEGITLLAGPLYHSAQWAFSFLPMVAGSAVVMRHKFNPEETLDLIDKYKITNTHMVPTQFVRLLRLDDEIKNSFKGSSLKLCWHGAAPCPHEIKRKMIEWWGPIIFEYYGSTEGSIITACTSDEWLERPGTLGKPLPIIEPHIIKEDGTKAGPNEHGQLYFKNLMGSSFEYHKEPDKTKEAYLEPGVSTFGDIGYLDEDGYLFMSDRKIDMIISGGVNIYPAEIEDILSNHPAISDCAIFGVPNEEWGEEVKAAVELKKDYTASDELTQELIAFTAKHLAKYKAPKSIDYLEEMPRTVTGKLLKRKLRDKYWEKSGRTI